MLKHLYNLVFPTSNKQTITKKINPALLGLAFMGLCFTSKAQVGEALDFNGTSDRVDLPAATFVSGSYTKEAWINISNLANFNNIVSGTATAFWAPSAQLTSGHGGGFNDVVDPTPLVASTWYHVAVTYDAGTQLMNLYKNGILVAGPVSVAPIAETEQYIGAYQTGFLFAGQMDEVRIWNVAKSAAEILASKDCELSGDEPGLLAYYSFNQDVAGADNSATTLLLDNHDVCVPANGTLVGFTLNGATSNFIAPGATISGSCFSLPNIKVTGNNLCINNGDNTPSVTDFTSFGVYTNAPIIKTFSIINSGTATLNITLPANVGGPDAADFVVTTPPATSVLAGDSTTVSIKFTPSGALGIKSATISIDNDDSDENPFVFSIEGDHQEPGLSLQFDGNDDYISLPNSILTSSYTKEAWIYADGLTAFGHNILSGTNTAFWVKNEGGNYLLTAGHDLGTTFTTVQDVTPITTGTWHHVAVTFDATSQLLSLYKDGLPVGTPTTDLVVAEPLLYVGAFDNAGLPDFFWNGKIDEVRIWNRALTAAEILANSNCELTGDEDGLTAYYNFNQGIANVDNTGLTTLNDNRDAADLCSVFNNGILNNFGLAFAGFSNWVFDTDLSASCTGLPNIALTGNTNCILNGDNTPDIADGTDFGSYMSPGIDKVFTITNTGTATLTITTPTISGVDMARFTVTVPPASLVLAAGASTTFTVRFVAPTNGMKFATINIVSDDPDTEAAFSFDIQGLGQIPLPVTLQSFNGQVQENVGVKLTWKTTAEINSKGFDVLRLAADGTTWEKIGFVQSINSSTAVTYTFTDRLPLPGVNTYRLKQVDVNGDYKLSNIIALNFRLDHGLISIYPNPVKDKFGIVFSDNKLKNSFVQISTVAGTVITKINLVNNYQQVDVSKLPSGIYLLSFSNGEVKRLVKQK